MIAKAKARAGSVRQSLGLATHRAHEPTDARAGGAVISVPDLGILAKQRAPGSLEEQMIIERRRRRPADDADDAPVGGGGGGGGGSGWPSWTFEHVTFTSLIAPLALEEFLDLDESRSSRSSSPDVRRK